MADEKPPIKPSESDASVEMNKPAPGALSPAQMQAATADTTKMVAPGTKVKIKAIRDINISKTPGEQKILKPNEVAEVTPEQAIEFCDHKFRGNYPYSGERYEDAQPAAIVRAVRV